MSKGVFQLPEVKNEPVKSYAPGTPERVALKQKLAELNQATSRIFVLLTITAIFWVTITKATKHRCRWPLTRR